MSLFLLLFPIYLKGIFFSFEYFIVVLQLPIINIYVVLEQLFYLFTEENFCEIFFAKVTFVTAFSIINMTAKTKTLKMVFVLGISKNLVTDYYCFLLTLEWVYICNESLLYR